MHNLPLFPASGSIGSEEDVHGLVGRPVEVALADGSGDEHRAVQRNENEPVELLSRDERVVDLEEPSGGERREDRGQRLVSDLYPSGRAARSARAPTT